MHAAITRTSFIAAAALLAACANLPSSDVVLRQADNASGAALVKSFSFTGRGTGSTFGQAWQPGNAWPLLNYSVLTRVADYDNGAFREDFGRSRGELTGGGATPLMGQGETRSIGLARGEFAWNLAGTNAAANPAALDARLHDLWTTPHGAIKAAQRNGAKIGSQSEGGQTFTTFSYSVPGHLAATAWVGTDGLISRIDSTMPHPVLGDMDVTTRYSDWRDAGSGVKFPMRIRQTQGGFEVLDFAVQSVQVNPAVDIAVPDNVRNFAERVASEKVADGVWFLGGGSHNSVAIEMSNHVVLVESPLYDGRAAAVFAEVARLVPGKPIRTVINSHHHFDHAGGLRAAAAEGAGLVTSSLAKPYFERVFANPNRIAPDKLAKSGRSAAIVGVDGRLALNDGARRIEIHEMQGSVHSVGFMLIYLPAERLLIEADAYTPGAPGSAPPPVVNANNQNLVDNIDRLQLKVDRILPLHGRVVPMSELNAMVGRKS